ncbi:MAG TPA: hypothetical protein PLI18_07790 [Pirellulaceae bacterium]|nr:hypothetical protein [Pirellulaceae bacterium]
MKIPGAATSISIETAIVAATSPDVHRLAEGMSSRLFAFREDDHPLLRHDQGRDHTEAVAEHAFD